MGLVNDFGQFWYLTIMPYEKDIEPGVPDKSEVIEAFKHLSRAVGAEACGWRYDPIYVDEKYTVDFYLRAFEKMASALDKLLSSYKNVYRRKSRLHCNGLRFAKEAARAVRDWVFENTKYDTIYSYMKYTNVASYSTALSNGMKKVKEYPDPKNEISYAYAITRKEWEEL